MRLEIGDRVKVRSGAYVREGETGTITKAWDTYGSCWDVTFDRDGRDVPLFVTELDKIEEEADGSVSR